jgi:peptidoglycan/xylan/chitin deacetylase (PgdA/CDA1 family)
MIADSQRADRHGARAGGISGPLGGLKPFVKRLLFVSGLFEAWHRRRNRSYLTVVGFHRVLPPQDARFEGSNPAYTVTPDELDQCLCLFDRFYNVVSLAQVGAARAGKEGLPDCPLLITFDDGWQDNFQYALPVLKQHSLPAVLFVATGCIGSERGFWQEEVLDAVLRHRISVPHENASGSMLIADLTAMPRAQRESYLDRLPDAADLPRRMIDVAELASLRAGGVAIGAHGHSHEPMTELENPQTEFAACRERLGTLKLFEPPAAFSFPHGRFNAKLVSLATASGFDLLFTSKHVLTPSADLPACETIGRIEMDLRRFRLAARRLDSAPFMFHLATQPSASSRAQDTNSGGADAES